MKDSLKNRIYKISNQSIEFRFYKFLSSPLMMLVYAFLMMLVVFAMVGANVNMGLVILLTVVFGTSGVFLSVILRVIFDEYDEAHADKLNETDQ